MCLIILVLTEGKVICPCRITHTHTHIYIHRCVCVCVCVCVLPVSDVGTLHFISPILVRKISYCYLTILIHVFLIVPYNPPLFAHLSLE